MTFERSTQRCGVSELESTLTLTLTKSYFDDVWRGGRVLACCVGDPEPPSSSSSSLLPAKCAGAIEPHSKLR